MYDFPELREAHDEFWGALAARLAVAGLKDVPRALTRSTSLGEVWGDDRLLFAQGCEYPLAKAFGDRVRVVAHPAYSAAGCEGARYRSAIIVRAAPDDGGAGGKPAIVTNSGEGADARGDGYANGVGGGRASVVTNRGEEADARGDGYASGVGGRASVVTNRGERPDASGDGYASVGVGDTASSCRGVGEPRGHFVDANAGDAEVGRLRRAPIAGAGADVAAPPLARLRGRRCVVNELDSNSGMNLLRDAVAPFAAAGGRFFGSVVVSGSHLRSVEMVASGEADVASIDCVSFAHFQRLYPSLVSGVRVLDWTASSPSLPYITSGSASDATVQALRTALADVFDDRALTSVRERLLLRGVDLAPSPGFGEVLALERQAAEAGYPALR